MQNDRTVTYPNVISDPDRSNFITPRAINRPFNEVDSVVPSHQGHVAGEHDIITNFRMA